MKTKEKEGSPVWWRLSLTDPGSVWGVQTVAPLPQLIHDCSQRVVYLFISEKQPNKIINGARRTAVLLSRLKISKWSSLRSCCSSTWKHLFTRSHHWIKGCRVPFYKFIREKQQKDKRGRERWRADATDINIQILIIVAFGWCLRKSPPGWQQIKQIKQFNK